MQPPIAPDTLSKQRCRNHGQREAVACCPNCKGNFCRECITEHQGQLLCSHCLQQLTSHRSKDKNFIPRLFIRLVALAIGLLIVFSCFYTVTKLLAAIPQQYHRSYIGV